MTPSEHFKNVVVFGAGGTNIGHHVVKALASKPDLFNVSIIARRSSKSTFPAGVTVHYVDDDLPHEQLVDALRGQDAVVSAIGFGAIAVEEKLVDAAVEARVKRFLPSEYGVNNANPAARALCPVFDAKGAIIEYLKQKESSGLSWTAVPTGLWLDWTLDPSIAFADIHLQTRTAHLWQNGTHKLSWSTLPWAAEGIAQILLAPPARTANKVIPLHGASASQNDILAALERLQLSKGSKYATTHFADPAELIPQTQRAWRESNNNDTAAALLLVKAGFFLDGYGSDFVGEGITPVGNEFLELPPLDFEGVIAEAVRRWA
ncbi:hypothetical protein CLAIMM_12004 [Cladophialophora immunda]|nr:hypothetical protein CLAIMM_12004 [Cladophialophora immunda]